jgi:hypothetical protein
VYDETAALPFNTVLYFAIGYPQVRSDARIPMCGTGMRKLMSAETPEKIHAYLSLKLPGPNRNLKWLGSFF